MYNDGSRQCTRIRHILRKLYTLSSAMCVSGRCCPFRVRRRFRRGFCRSDSGGLNILVGVDVCKNAPIPVNRPEASCVEISLMLLEIFFIGASGVAHSKTLNCSTLLRKVQCYLEANWRVTSSIVPLILCQKVIICNKSLPYLTLYPHQIR